MGKSKMRNLTIDNNGTSENWKWIISRENIIVQKENGKKQFIPNPNSERDSDNYVAITPGMIAEYIRTKILGLEPKVLNIKPTKTTVVPDKKTITKSKIYIVMKKVYFMHPEYGQRTHDEYEFEYWLDPSKAKIRADELNQDARNLYIYDEMIKESSIYRTYGELSKLIKNTTFKDVDQFSNTNLYSNIIEDIENYRLGYEFRAIEKDLNV